MNGQNFGNGGGIGNPITANLKIPLDDLPYMKCACGGSTFQSVKKVKFVNAFYTGDARPSGMLFEKWRCMKCGILFPNMAMDKADIKKFCESKLVLRMNDKGETFDVEGNLLPDGVITEKGQ